MAKIEKRKVWMALVMVPPILLLIALGPPSVLHLMVLLATFLGLREYYNLVLPHSEWMERTVGIGLGMILSIIISFGDRKEVSFFLVIILLVLSILFMATSKDLSSTIWKIGMALFGILFIGFLLAYVSLIRNMTNGKLWVLFLITTIWAGDISALLSGSFFGRHKLYPKISPNKTFEGLGGAVVGSIVVALAFAFLFIPHLEKEPCIFLAIGLGIFGQLGDFTESMLKRSAQVKDSGTLIPGHGGMLDRLDSFLFSAPFLHYSLLYLLKENPMKRLSILGSTGSIGVNTLHIVNQFPERFEVVSLSAGHNTQLLKQQILQFQPKIVSVLNKELAEALQRELTGAPVQIVHGVEGLIKVATHPEVDQVVSAMVGAVGLIPTLSAIKTGKTIALANKEPLVMAGKIVMEEAKRNNVQILPVDSEHSAIFQALLGHRKEDVRRLILTASGGPFFNLPFSRLQDVTVKEALSHPHWEMGKKITIDSASLMNKGLEVIEAYWLFNIPFEKIVVLIHPQSVVHSMVEYIDGSIVAQMGITDMKIPISYALSFPERLPLKLPPLDLSKSEALTFYPPDPERFPCLKLAYRSIEIGETMPAILNAANEMVVSAFLEGSLKFTEIPLLLQRVMEEHEVKPVHTVEDILRADHWAREKAKALLEGRKVC